MVNPWRYELDTEPAPIILENPWICVESGTAGTFPPTVNPPIIGDPIDLATGEESHLAKPDLTVYNPTGPSIAFTRSYRTTFAKDNYQTPGLTRGWAHEYDTTIQGPALAGTWGALKFHYTNGAVEELTPQLDIYGTPTGEFTEPIGSSYRVIGDPDSTTGVWEYVTIIWKDGTQSRFTPLSGTPGMYVLSRITDKVENYVTLNWNSSRKLTTIVDGASSSTLLTCAYGGNGLLSSVTDVNGRKVSFTYTTPTGLSMLCLHTASQIVPSNEANPTTLYTYGYESFYGAPLLTAITQPSPTGTGNSTLTFNYTNGRVTEQVDGNGNKIVVTYHYIEYGTRIEYKDSQDNVTKLYIHYFTEDGLDAGTEDSHENRTTIAYEDEDNPYKPTSITLADGRCATFTYDDYGNLISDTNYHHAIGEIDRLITTHYTYAYNTGYELGRLTSIYQTLDDDDQRSIDFTYTTNHNLIKSITMPMPGTVGSTATVSTVYTYDFEDSSGTLGNIVKIVTPGNDADDPEKTFNLLLNYTTDGQYSQSAAIGQPLVVKTVDEDENTITETHYRYDRTRGQLSKTIDADGHETEATYNIDDSLASILLPALGQDPDDRTHFALSYLHTGGQLSQIELHDANDVLSGAMKAEYGQEGETLSIQMRDDLGNYDPTMSASYDSANQIDSLSDGLDQETAITYTTGRFSSLAYPLGDSIHATSYDAVSRVIEEQVKDAGNSAVSTTIYTYDEDPEGRLTEIDNPGTGRDITLTYEAHGWLDTISDGTGKSIAYTYDDLGNVLTTETSYPDVDPQTITYTYHANGLRKSMSLPDGTTLTYKYDQAGRPISLEDARTGRSTRTTGWAYNTMGLLESQTYTVGGSAIAYSLYDYNARGQLTRLRNYQEAGENDVLLSDFDEITYDSADNLSGFDAAIQNFAGFSGQRSFDYDAKWRLTEEDLTDLPAVGGNPFAFNYDDAGNITQFKDASHQYSYNENNQIDDEDYVYDAFGNPIWYNNIPIEWTPDGLLTEYNDGELTAGYLPDGRRAWKQSGATRTYFLYDGLQMAAEMGSGGNITAVHVFGANGLISRGNTFYMFDPMGNIVHRLDTSGNVLANDCYDAWGNLLASTDPNGSPYDVSTDPVGYKGQCGYFTDRETDLILCTFRYYDPNNGRWLSRDPIGYDGGINLYQYSANNPILYNDPSGLLVTLPYFLVAQSIDYLNYLDLWPDYYTFNMGVGTGICGVNFKLTMDRYGKVYFGAGPYVGLKFFPAGWLPSVHYGWIPQMNTASPKQLQKLLTGPGGTITINPALGWIPPAIVAAPETGGLSLATALLLPLQVGLDVSGGGVGALLGAGVPFFDVSGAWSWQIGDFDFDKDSNVSSKCRKNL